jgi:hypothetical protein
MTEACMGLAQIDEDARCVKCNQIMSGNSLRPLNNDSELNVIVEASQNEVVPYLEKNKEY